jgi:hypothetical protein
MPKSQQSWVRSPLPTENAAGCANHNVRTVALDDGLVLGNGQTTEEYANLQK